MQTEDDTDVSGADSSDTESDSSASGKTGNSNILIAYFTYGENAELASEVDASATASIQIFDGEAIGNTGVMAHMIAEASGLHIGGSSVSDAESRVNERVTELGLSEE